MNISFKTLQEHCSHHGWIKNGQLMCNYKNGQKAKCWAEWQECKEKNCTIVHPEIEKRIDDQLPGQMNIDQYLGGQQNEHTTIFADSDGIENILPERKVDAE